MDYARLNGKKIFVTGATGLIGKALVNNIVCNCPQASVVACVRNEQKAKKVFGGIQDKIELFVTDIKDVKPVDMGIDYIIHGASITSSKAFSERPSDVIKESVIGTENMLEFAVKNGVQSFVLLSTMEIYGFSAADRKIYEDSPSYLDTMNVRTCYPESKRLCESLCAAYCAQYGVPTRVVRLTQTFGDGVEYNDGRVFAEFARCVIENRDIVLKTKGETRRSYLYTDDAVAAILTVLLDGENGTAYNAANEKTYCSIYEMARIAASFNNCISVRIEESDITASGYAPTLNSDLSCERLNSLGWSATVDLKNMFDKLIGYMRNSVENGQTDHN